jgi:hypothetical protein
MLGKKLLELKSPDGSVGPGQVEGSSRLLKNPVL